ncbi:hypothetical protein [Nostoc sp.]|uniref:hypothetical protein n=1 Tax=Nostoc sp. TaxID=1180 RepID=UPI002FFAF075
MPIFVHGRCVVIAIAPLYAIDFDLTPKRFNFLVNLMAGLATYTYLPKKRSIDISPKDLPA